MEIAIEAKSLKFWYNQGNQQLFDVNLAIPRCTTTAIMGPSGCGKSTLLRCFNRIFDLYPDQHAEGEILIDGTNILSRKTDVNLLRAKVGMVFQKPTPFPMSIADNILFGVRLYEKLSKAESAMLVEKTLRRAGLWEEVKDRLKESALMLSGGQQQRLCIARTIAVRPKIILMDEPCSALDPIATAKIEELIDELREEYTVVMLTHNKEQASRISQFVSFMYLGQMIEFGRTDKIMVAPDHELTERFLTGRFG